MLIVRNKSLVSSCDESFQVVHQLLSRQMRANRETHPELICSFSQHLSIFLDLSAVCNVIQDTNKETPI